MGGRGYMNIRFFRDLKAMFKKDKYLIYENGISLLNYDGGEWLKEFIEFNFPEVKKFNLCISSVNGKRTNLSKYSGKKIFCTGENVEKIKEHKYTSIKFDGQYRWFERIQDWYSDCRVKEVDLSLGFSDIEEWHQNYVRFPNWLTWMIPPHASNDDIKRIVARINKSRSKAVKDAVCINKHDTYGLRTKICDDLYSIVYINYPGVWRHNDDDLWNLYNNNKIEYLSLFKFNICPENMDVPYYCTEKIFDAFLAGCIPIYAGCDGFPETDCINRDAVIFWDLDDEQNYAGKKMVKRLMEDEMFYRKFCEQEKLKPRTVDYIVDRMDTLRSRIANLL